MDWDRGIELNGENQRTDSPLDSNFAGFGRHSCFAGSGQAAADWTTNLEHSGCSKIRHLLLMANQEEGWGFVGNRMAASDTEVWA